MLKTIIDGKVYGRGDVLAREAKRMAAVRRKLGLPRSDAPLDRQRAELTHYKLKLGHDGIRQALGSGPWLSEKITRLTARLSGADRKFSVCEIEVPRGSAAHFAKWFEDRNTLDDERECSTPALTTTSSAVTPQAGSMFSKRPAVHRSRVGPWLTTMTLARWWRNPARSSPIRSREWQGSRMAWQLVASGISSERTVMVSARCSRWSSRPGCLET